MKLVLPAVPDAWRDDGIAIEASAVGALPEDVVAWARHQLQGGPILSRREASTTAGWPAVLFEGELAGSRCFLAAYQFVDHGALALVRCPAAHQDARRDEIVELLLSATIDWEGQPLLTLAQILAP